MKCRVANVNRNSISSCQGGHWPIKPGARMHHSDLIWHATAIIGVFTPRKEGRRRQGLKYYKVIKTKADLPGVGVFRR